MQGRQICLKLSNHIKLISHTTTHIQSSSGNRSKRYIITTSLLLMNNNGYVSNILTRSGQIPVNDIEVRSDSLFIDHKFIWFVCLLKYFHFVLLIWKTSNNFKFMFQIMKIFFNGKYISSLVLKKLICTQCNHIYS